MTKGGLEDKVLRFKARPAGSDGVHAERGD
jgi:hypothetical protein